MIANRFQRRRIAFVKALLKLLQGAWLKHPLHPILVSLPFGLWFAAGILDITSYAAPGTAIFHMAKAAILIGLVATLAAVPTGFADWIEIKRGRPARRLGLIHAAGNVTAALLWLVTLVLRWNLPAGRTDLPASAFVVSVAAFAVTLASAYLGGRLVYEYGIGVARFSKDKLRAAAVAAGANVPQEKS
jgi:uncharacterized membrane protein